MTAVLMICLAFVCGSLPFSVWIGKLLLGKEIRQLGDGNPGAANVFRTGNTAAGILALMLDISKAAAPVGVSYFNLGIRGFPILLIAIAPILGHTFSPFLGFRGGKAIASTLGIWIGLTLWKASLPGVIGAVIGITLFTPAGWSVMAAMTAILMVLLIWLPDPILLGVWVLDTLILTWTHRHDMQQGLHLRPWIRKLFSHSKD